MSRATVVNYDVFFVLCLGIMVVLIWSQNVQGMIYHIKQDTGFTSAAYNPTIHDNRRARIECVNICGSSNDCEMVTMTTNSTTETLCKFYGLGHMNTLTTQVGSTLLYKARVVTLTELPELNCVSSTQKNTSFGCFRAIDKDLTEAPDASWFSNNEYNDFWIRVEFPVQVYTTSVTLYFPCRNVDQNWLIKFENSQGKQLQVTRTCNGNVVFGDCTNQLGEDFDADFGEGTTSFTIRLYNACNATASTAGGMREITVRGFYEL